MTIAVDARSNSLIVTAPEPLFEEVKLLVEMIDQAGLDSIEDVSIVTLKRANPEVVQKAHESIMGVRTGSTASSSSSASRPSTPSGAPSPFGGASPDDIRRRIEFFQRMRGGGGFGGGPPGGAPTGATGGRGGAPTSRGGASPRGRGSTRGRGGR